MRRSRKEHKANEIKIKMKIKIRKRISRMLKKSAGKTDLLALIYTHLFSRRVDDAWATGISSGVILCYRCRSADSGRSSVAGSQAGRGSDFGRHARRFCQGLQPLWPAQHSARTLAQGPLAHGSVLPP